MTTKRRERSTRAASGSLLPSPTTKLAKSFNLWLRGTAARMPSTSSSAVRGNFPFASRSTANGSPSFATSARESLTGASSTPTTNRCSAPVSPGGAESNAMQVSSMSRISPLTP